MNSCIGNNIKSLRLLHGLTQLEFASRIGCTKSLIALIETGKRDASSKLIQKLCDRFSIRPDRIYDKDFLSAS